MIKFNSSQFTKVNFSHFLPCSLISLLSHLPIAPAEDLVLGTLISEYDDSSGAEVVSVQEEK